LRTQFIYLLSARVFASAAQAVVLLILARVVDVNSFGVLNSALAAGLLAVGAADFGTSTLLAKAQAKRDFETADACIKFSVSTTFICIVALLVAVAWYTKFDSLTGPLITLAVGVSLEKNAECLLSVPMANGNKFIAPLSVLLRRSVTLLAFVCMLPVGVSGEWAYGLSYLVGSVAGQIHLRHTVAEAPPLWSPGKLGLEIMRKAFPYFVSNISAQSRLLDLPVVALISSAVAAGLYAGATKVTSPFMLIPTVLTALIMPHAVRQRKHMAAALARKMFIFAVLSELLFFAPLALFSDRLVVLLLGHAFTAAAPAFAWTLVGIPFFGLASPLGSVLQSQGKERIVAVNGVVFAVVSLCGTATLCILFGIWGAAAAMTISYGLKCIVLMLIINRTLKRTHRRMSTERADADEMSPQHAGGDEARPEVHDERIGGPPSTYSTWRKGGNS
jgi:O-antigen/teichoic acid export membrane protein